MSPSVVFAFMVFVAISVVVGSVMGGAGGWRALTERYPALVIPPFHEDLYRFTSVRTGGGVLGTAYYGNCVTVGVSSRGLSLALWKPFALFHPPLFIPWEALKTCRRFEHYRRGPWALITLRDGGDLTVTAKAASAILSHAAERGLIEGAGERQRDSLNF